MKYRKKPVVIEAVQFFDDAETLMKLSIFMDQDIHVSCEDAENPVLFIETLEGSMKAAFGDYIIKGIKGEFYPCKPDIFEKTYEVVSAEVESCGMSFGIALELLKKGCKLAREGWNGKGLFVVYQKAYPEGIPCNKQTSEAWGMSEGELFKCEPYLQIKTTDGSHAMWVPSIRDCLAEDWVVVE